MTTPPRSILVLGAGELGLPILRHLARLAPDLPYAATLHVLLRPSTIASPSAHRAAELESLRSLGIGLVPGDLMSATHAELISLFRPHHTVVDCGGMARPAGGQLKVAKAVLEAGVRRYIPWQFGVDYDEIGYGSGQDLFDEQLDLREMLRGQRETQWVVVSTGMFTSFLFEPSFGLVERDGEGEGYVVRGLGSWENRVSVTSPEDIGRVTARVVFEDGICDEVVYCAGDTVSYARLAEIVEEVRGRVVRREVWTVRELEEELRRDPGNGMLKYRLVFAKGTGCSWPAERTVNATQAMEMENVRGFAGKWAGHEGRAVKE